VIFGTTNKIPITWLIISINPKREKKREYLWEFGSLLEYLFSKNEEVITAQKREEYPINPESLLK